ncbi:hypothetical protein [Gayadomonas joobiniege]|uniref:hypothetical protein n=1 Tax=Gayadomonas joobiniege TaxID=1234606 RepID=UPI00037F90BA|nr:hypothetical protein [Gayadomonas joobiniege]
MIFTIVIALVVTLIIVAVVMNAIQQHKEKVESERRNEIAKQKTIIEETENLLLNLGTIPASPNLVLVLQQRILSAVQTLHSLVPDSLEYKQRVADAQARIQTLDAQPETLNNDDFTLPDDERAIITLLQNIKKLRAAIRAEHSKGKVDTHLFVSEDKRLDQLQLKINIESMMRRGQTARHSKMLGSARQLYEKALSTLQNQLVNSDYVSRKRQEIESILEQINQELKNSNDQDRLKRAEKEKDDLDVLFQPKKKW